MLRAIKRNIQIAAKADQALSTGILEQILILSGTSVWN